MHRAPTCVNQSVTAIIIHQLASITAPWSSVSTLLPRENVRPSLVALTWDHVAWAEHTAGISCASGFLQLLLDRSLEGGRAPYTRVEARLAKTVQCATTDLQTHVAIGQALVQVIQPESR